MLVRDLLQLEYQPLCEVLRVDPLRTEDQMNEEEEKKPHVNTNITPMGRPVNMHPHIRWKPVEMNKPELETVEESAYKL